MNGRTGRLGLVLVAAYAFGCAPVSRRSKSDKDTAAGTTGGADATEGGGDAGTTGEGRDDATDEDAGTTTGEPTVCATDAECDDSSECTTDVCGVGGLCKHLPAAGPCDDGNPCTLEDACVEGACDGVAKECGDGNPCTDDTCDPASGECAFPNNQAPCDDANACTESDTCGTGTCQGVAVLCNDADPCTDDFCDGASGACDSDPTPDFSACDAGQKCTTNDVCIAGSCTPGPELNCDDGNPCTNDGCSAGSGQCTHIVNTAPCDDGDACTSGDKCANKSCKSGPPKSCDDGNECTDDSCSPFDGSCASFNNADPCNDGDFCTTGDKCSGGECAGPAPVNCDDGDVCTDDYCSIAAQKCDHIDNNAPCDDGDGCTQGDECSFGSCFGGPQTNCDDAEPCTDDNCTNGSCKSTPDNSNFCTDGDACTSGDHCSSGSCESTPIDCDDGDACTIGEYCDFGNCVDGTPLDCDDFNPCTADACTPGTGKCVNSPMSEGEECDNGLLCLVGECKAGACVDTEPVDCDDEDVCTTDACSPTLGCENTAKDCDDAVACTADSCDPQTGQCGNTPDDGACDDGFECTTDACSAALGCTHAENHEVCDDELACSVDFCSSEIGCTAWFGEECGGGTGLSEGFENGLPAGWTTTGSNTLTKWQVVTGQQAFGGEGALYYGNPIDLDYADGDTNGTVTLPEMTLSGSVEPSISFRMWHDTEVSSSFDNLSVRVNGTVVWSKSSTHAALLWHQVSVSIAAYQGQTVTIALFFDTGDSAFNSGEGLYVDDLQVGGAAGGAQCNALDETFCDDGDPCTLDVCSAVLGCLNDAPTCDDGIDCTADTCNAETGDCAHAPDAALCDDGFACTADTCEAETGCEHAPDDGACDDGIDCTEDYCSPAEGCAAVVPPGCCEQVLSEDFESGALPPGWSVVNSSTLSKWQVATGKQAYSGQSALYYGNLANGDFDNGNTNGTVTTAPLPVPNDPNAKLTFRWWYDTEGGPSLDKIAVLVGSTTLWTKDTESTGTWHFTEVSLAAYAGQVIQLKLLFDTGDSIGNDGEGVYLDDLLLTTCP